MDVGPTDMGTFRFVQKWLHHKQNKCEVRLRNLREQIAVFLKHKEDAPDVMYEHCADCLLKALQTQETHYTVLLCELNRWMRERFVLEALNA